MKKISIFGYSWYYDTETKTFYENEDKVGGSFTLGYKHLTSAERQKIKEQFLINNIQYSL